MTKRQTFNLFVPLSKIDEEKRLVYGLATAEVPDRAKEVCHYETTKPFFEKWSGDISKASNGKSLGNLRAMHGSVAAGKLTDIFFDDDKKQIEICAKVVDDAEWAKVMEGVYTGFSQGGKYAKRWKDAESGYTYFTAEPTEISLVDVPCLPSATFEVVKRDGAHEKRAFQNIIPEPTHDAIKREAEMLAADRGPGNSWRALVDEALEKLWRRAQDEAFEELVKRDFSQGERDFSQGEREIIQKAARVARQIALNPAYASVAANAEKSADGIRGVVVVNKKAGKLRSLFPAEKTAASLRLEKGFVIVEGDSVFPPESAIPFDGKEFAFSPSAFLVLANVEKSAGGAFGASVAALPYDEFNDGLLKFTDPATSDALLFCGSPTEGSLAYCGVSVNLEALIVKGAKAPGLVRSTTSLETAFHVGVSLSKRDFSDARREDLAGSGKAMKDGSFPIVNRQDLKNAIKAVGRAKDPDKAKAHIKARAKALGAEGELPDNWKIAEAEGLQKFEPVTRYDCGCADHKHLEKAEAVECMRKGALAAEVDKTLAPAREALAALEKAVTGEEPVEKVAVPPGAKGAKSISKPEDPDAAHEDMAKGHDESAKAHDGAAEFHEKTASTDDAAAITTRKHLAAAKAHGRAADAHRAAADAHRSGDDEAADSSEKAHALSAHAAEKSGEAFGKALTTAELAKLYGEENDALDKGMYHVARLASMVEDLKYLCDCCDNEAAREGDGSTVPANLKSLASQLGQCLVDMAAEEVGELFTAEGNAELPEPAMAYASAIGDLAKRDARFEPLAKRFEGADPLLVELRKLGARNSASDMDRLQKCHDLMKEMGANCASMDGKSAAIDDLRKDFEEREAMTKASIEDLTKQLVAMKKLAAPARAAIFAVTKDVDSGAQSGDKTGAEKVEEVLAKMTPEQVTELLMKDALRKPFSPNWG